MDFEYRIRHDFRNSQPKWAVDVDVEVEFPDLGLEEGYMIFTNAEILQCFDPVVNAVLDLVKVQIAKIRALNGNLQVRALSSEDPPFQPIGSSLTAR